MIRKRKEWYLREGYPGLRCAGFDIVQLCRFPELLAVV